jgi:hypothetical protein
MGDRYVRVPQTRFVTEAMLRLFEIVVGPGHAGGPSAAAKLASLPAVDIAASLRGMWK